MDLALIPTGLALILAYYLRNEQPAVLESQKLRGACGIGTLVKHRSCGGFMRRLAKRESRPSRLSLPSPWVGWDLMPL